MVGSFVARPIGLALTGPVAGLVGMRGWMRVVACVVALSALAPLLSREVRTLERR